MEILQTKNLFEEIKPLLIPQPGPAISIYIPTSPVWNEVSMARIHLKNHLKKLDDSGYTELTDKIKKKTESDEFWRKLSHGLGIFISDSVEKYILIPTKVRSSAKFGKYFNIKPLLKYLTDSTEYYILILNRNNVEVLKCTDSYFEKLEIASMPTSIDEILMSDEPEKQLQFRSVGKSNKGSKGQVAFYGQGGDNDFENKNITKLLSMIDSELTKEVASQETRVIVAGIEPHFFEFKKISKLNLGEEFISGSFEKPNYQEILNSAWEIIQRENEDRRVKALEQYNNQSASNLTITNSTDITRLAQQGRIAVLYVKNIEATHAVDLGDTSQDIVNTSMIYTLVNGGDVIRIKKGELTTTASLAALLRY